MTQRSITLGLVSYSYTLRRYSRARGLRVAISADAEIFVSAPRWMSDRLIERIVTEASSWIEAEIKKAKEREIPLLARGGKREFLRYKEAARRFVMERLRVLNESYGFSFGRISIRNQKTRWGSCSRQGNLSFNYRIVLLPAVLADYVIVHELCHRGAFDHSPCFWRLIERSMPQYREWRAMLRRL